MYVTYVILAGYDFWDVKSAGTARDGRHVGVAQWQARPGEEPRHEAPAAVNVAGGRGRQHALAAHHLGTNIK